MRILFVSELVPASEQAEITGGVEARLHYATRHLAARPGVEVEVLADRTDGTRWDAASLGSLPRRIALLARLLTKGMVRRCDVIEASNLVVYPLGWLLGLLKRRPVVFWYPDVLLGSWRGGRFGRAGVVGELTERLVLKLPVARYLAISASTKAKLVAAGVAPARIDVVGCGYEPEVVRRVLAAVRSETAERRTDGSVHVVVVSRLVPYKRVDLVIRALARLAPTHPDLVLDVVGQGPERAALEALAGRLGVAGRVRFHGFVAAHADVLGIVARARVFVSMSEIEGFGIVVVEAMALGVPFVVSDIDVFREVTAEGTGGLVVARGDETALAGAVATLVDDDERHASERAAGQARARQYTWAAVARQTEAVFASVVAAHHPPSPIIRRLLRSSGRPKQSQNAGGAGRRRVSRGGQSAGDARG